MSVSLTTTHHGGPRTSYYLDFPARRTQPKPNMFDNLRKKLSKRSSSNPLSSSSAAEPKSTTSRSGLLAPQSNNPFALGSPSTRRPSRSGMNAFTTPSNEPPPAYTPTPAFQNTATTTQPSLAASSDASSDNDPYAFLKSFDTIFLIDDSTSMRGRSWSETAEAIKTIAPICTQRDENGIDIYFLNQPDKPIYQNVKLSSTVNEIFSDVYPEGPTPTGQRLNKILKPYLARYTAAPNTTKPINIIVITDGEPTDDVESPIIQAARRLDKLDAPPWQVGIQFFQVGKERGAREHLKQLDDGLRDIAGDQDLRDIVDTVPFTSENGDKLSAAGIIKVVLGSVNRRLDRNSKELHR